MGLSPRLRGNPSVIRPLRCRYGSIPAPAGEPPARTRSPVDSTVYPRACGGTLPWARSWASCRGLSPRLRGNPSRQPIAVQPPGSIPAPAGEPHRVGHVHHLPEGLSPRLRGTMAVCTALSAVAGLSPRLRGNHCKCDSGNGWQRSIPAPAGEPGRPGLQHIPDRVYPRAYGGTWRSTDEVRVDSGRGQNRTLRRVAPVECAIDGWH